MSFRAGKRAINFDLTKNRIAMLLEIVITLFLLLATDPNTMNTGDQNPAYNPPPAETSTETSIIEDDINHI